LAGSMGGNTPEANRLRGTDMRTLIYTVGIVAIVLIVLGLIIKAVKWLIILGLIALVASIVMGVVKGRRALR
jgi:hypothetical protein